MTRYKYWKKHDDIIDDRNCKRSGLKIEKSIKGHYRDYDRAWGEIDLATARKLDQLDYLYKKVFVK